VTASTGAESAELPEELPVILPVLLRGQLVDLLIASSQTVVY
jgi:hypothetical protein